MYFLKTSNFVPASSQHHLCIRVTMSLFEHNYDEM